MHYYKQLAEGVKGRGGSISDERLKKQIQVSRKTNTYYITTSFYPQDNYNPKDKDMNAYSGRSGVIIDCLFESLLFNQEDKSWGEVTLWSETRCV